MQGIIVGSLCQALRAGDALSHVPSDVAGVFIFNDLQTTLRNVTGFFARVDSDFDLTESELTADTVVLEEALGLKAGTCDFSKPFLVVLTRPGMHARSLVIGFTPKNREQFAGQLTGRSDSIQRLSSGIKNRYVLFRDGMAFISERKKAIRTFIGGAGKQSLSASLDKRQKQLCFQNDIVFHLRVESWRAVYISPFMPILSQLARTGMTVQSMPKEKTEAVTEVVDWFLERIGSVVDQMEGVTLALSFDGKGFRFIHDHTFTPDGTVADYLSTAEQTDVDLWTCLPDRPFFMAGASDWVSAADRAVVADLAERVLSVPSVSEKISEDERRRLIEVTSAFYGQMRGFNMMLSTREGELQPLEMIGTYVFEDPARVAKQMRSILESSCQTLATFFPSSGYSIEPRACNTDGVSYDEYRFQLEIMDETTRCMVESVYGPNCCVRQAVVGKDRILYTLTAADADEFVKLVKSPVSSRNVGDNEHVRELVGHLATKPHFVMIFDIGQAMALGPRMMKAGMVAMNQSMPVFPELTVDTQGPLIGWSGTIRDRSVTGQAYISADGILRAVDLFKQFGEQMRRGFERSEMGSPGAEES
ncbi:MAG: hypothetical protein O7B26_07885 [Planctomycetota bacterium]|nr:hypothetical protein [Planctomycetota bacterium]